jgi:type I restriction enzyme, S subunit
MNLRQAQLPKGWVYCQLEDAVTKDSSNISINKIKDEDGEYPVFAAKGFVQNVSFYHQEEEYLAIIKDGAGIGRVTKHPAKSSVVATMQYLIPKKGFDINFIKYFLEGVDFEKHRNGSTIPHIYFKDYKSEKFPKLPLPEQRHIVSVLEECFAAIAKAKANAGQNLKNAKELFESYLFRVFENKGEGWEEKNLEELVDEKCTLSYGIVQPGEEFENGLPVIRPTDLKSRLIKIEGLKRIDPKLADGYKRTKLIGDELLLCVRGSTGVLSIATEELKGANVTRGIVPIRFDSKTIDQSFGYYLLISNYVQNQIRAKTYGAALMQINIGDLRKIETPYPKLEEQHTIVRQLDALRAETQKLEAVYKKKIADLEELKKSILQKAFAGELRGGELVEPTTEKELII